MTESIPNRYRHETQWPCYGLAWSVRSAPKTRLAISSCVAENTGNHIRVIDLNEETRQFEVKASADFTFPPTKLLWTPGEDNTTDRPDLLVSCSTTLDFWKVEDNELVQKMNLVNQRKQSGGKLAPLTSFDWSAINLSRLGCSSVDTTCAIWNVDKSQIETQFIAHDKAVNDMQFAPTDSNCIASAGADGSLRTFDLRNLESSLIVYEKPGHPFLRVAWNKVNTHLIATTEMDAGGVILMDLRRMSKPLSVFPESESGGCVNALTWAPHSQYHLLCGLNDGHAIIWDLKDIQAKPTNAQEGAPASPQYAQSLGLKCDHEIYALQWPSCNPNHVAIGMENFVDVVHV